MIALITPTGSRAFQFNLCVKWMQNQTYKGDVVWIIIDDCYPVTTNKVGENFKDCWTIIKVYPTPIWDGHNTQARNIEAGLKVLTENYGPADIEGIFIIEDDDYYRPVYLERMMANFGDYSLIGERNTIYYNVYYRKWITNPNTAHASLFQTAFKYEAIPAFRESFYHKFIDCVFWTKVIRRNLFYENDLAIGIKGLPGRGGIGAGHSKSFSMNSDGNMVYLKSKIGEDAKQYEGCYGDSSQSQHRLFAQRGL
jgi:hypothetical protein